ncbi:hypothetical protein ACC772_37905, partial [Rhizobium ruizarguesonis]
NSGVIVRRLDSMENLGSMDVLCTDKTGTLTEGVIRLDSCVDPQGVVSPEVRRLALLNSAFQSGMKNPLDDKREREKQRVHDRSVKQEIRHQYDD